MPIRRTTPAAAATLPKAGAADEVRVGTQLLLPKVAEGLVARRRGRMSSAERHQSDRKQIGLVRELRERYGPGPLRLRAAGFSVALVLDPDDVARVLESLESPFTAAARGPLSSGSRSVLATFQPHGSLITRGARRGERRRINEQALEAGRPMHSLAPSLVRVVREEAMQATALATERELTWDGFAACWWRAVRRIVLGDAARTDQALTRQLAQLRLAGNVPLLRAGRRRLRAEFLLRLQRQAFQAGPDTLAGQLHAVPAPPGADPMGQIPHWLFAFDAAGMATLRALALVATHPEEGARIRADLTGLDLDRPRELARLRACVLESVRLWPTTPLLLRESTEETHWRGAPLPAGTLFAVFAPYFHRAEPAAPFEDRFVPDIWLDGRALEHPAFVPFSGGPGRCPGEELVLLTASTWLATMLGNTTYQLDSHTPLHAQLPVPAALNPFGLRFTAQRG